MMWQIRQNRGGQLYVADDATDCATDGGKPLCPTHRQTLTLPPPCFKLSEFGRKGRPTSQRVSMVMKQHACVML